MGNVVIDMSMSLDGYIAAPNDSPEQGLGEDGMRLHNWAFEDPAVLEQVFGKVLEETGAVIRPARRRPAVVRRAAAAGRAGANRRQPDRRRDAPRVPHRPLAESFSRGT
jgi:hypothetical protein